MDGNPRDEERGDPPGLGNASIGTTAASQAHEVDETDFDKPVTEGSSTMAMSSMASMNSGSWNGSAREASDSILAEISRPSGVASRSFPSMFSASVEDPDAVTGGVVRGESSRRNFRSPTSAQAQENFRGSRSWSPTPQLAVEDSGAARWDLGEGCNRKRRNYDTSLFQGNQAVRTSYLERDHTAQGHVEELLDNLIQFAGCGLLTAPSGVHLGHENVPANSTGSLVNSGSDVRVMHDYPSGHNRNPNTDVSKPTADDDYPAEKCMLQTLPESYPALSLLHPSELEALHSTLVDRASQPQIVPNLPSNQEVALKDIADPAAFHVDMVTAHVGSTSPKASREVETKSPTATRDQRVSPKRSRVLIDNRIIPRPPSLLVSDDMLKERPPLFHHNSPPPFPHNSGEGASSVVLEAPRFQLGRMDQVTTTTTPINKSRVGQERAFHIMSERRRRGKMNALFSDLRAVVPTLTNVDRYSVLTDAVTHIRDLEKQLAELEMRKRQQVVEPADGQQKSPSTPPLPSPLVSVPTSMQEIESSGIKETSGMKLQMNRIDRIFLISLRLEDVKRRTSCLHSLILETLEGTLLLAPHDVSITRVGNVITYVIKAEQIADGMPTLTEERAIAAFAYILRE